MAKTSRPVPVASTSSLTSDDPVENVSLWLQANAKVLAIAGAVVVAAGLGIYGVRASDAKKRANASTALYAAQGVMYEGKTEEARTALEAVANRYSGTSAGDQAALLVAQTLYEEGKFAEGVQHLEEARGSVSRTFASSIDALIASGYEGQGDFVKAAEHYGKAATAAASEVERDAYVLAQARQLMTAGQSAEAEALFEQLRAKEASAFSQEAAVRLGELRAAPGR